MKLHGWTNANNTVLDHKSGASLHLLGLLRLADGTSIWAWEWPQTKSVRHHIEMNGGNNKRGLMSWAMSIIKPLEDT